MMGAALTFFWLMFGHALADYPLQGPFLSGMKRRANLIDGEAMWAWGLIEHSFIHAGFVLLFTKSPLCAVMEFISHGLIDFAKCEGKITMKQDQALHVAFKLLYVGLLWAGIV